ncbi:MAG: citramalate synthase [Coriobacteriales bacterium]|jgi:2-isopropylmalate synthase|nr:citramalate synthase [Coriobacteriales bacterium]
MVTLYDTTLRDGEQREGVSLTVEDKLRIAARLDALGVAYIEGGFPASNPTDSAFYEQARSLKLKQATISAFGTTARKGTLPSDDRALRALAACPASVVTLVGKAWELQVTEVLGVSADENLRMIHQSVRYLVDAGKRVFFDAEHFFDGYKHDAGYALAVLLVAAEAGAETLVLCDTNGGALPHEVFEMTAMTIEALVRGDVGAVVGIHAHNDGGCAVANSLEAVRAGATQVQGTINGFGERVGNADLLAVLANLQLKMGYRIVSDKQLALLTSTAHFVAEIFNIIPDPHLPYVGSSAFAHKGGIHASAALRYRHAYEHIDPALVGNFSRVVMSELAGKASLLVKAGELGVALPSDDRRLQSLLDTIKQREARGYSYEVADASLSLLLRAEQGKALSCFTLESFRVIAEKREDGRVMSEATIKLMVGGERYVATGEGNGPVNALDAALRLAIGRFYPQVETLELTDYKVRVLDESVGTGAVTRVLIETSDGATSWGTIGVSDNVIEASWDALVDAITYGLLVAGA